MDYLDSLNPVQREAVTWEGPSLLILAGAGSGKTRVITTRIAWLIDQKKMNPRSILAVTFTNKAAGEMRERVESMVPGAGGVMIRTFHSFGAWLMRTNAHLTPDLKQSFSIYDDDDSLSLLQTIFPGKTKKKLKPYAGWISRAKDYCLKPGDDLSRITTVPDFAAVYELYEKKLREIGNLDFGGLIARPVELFESDPELRRRIRQRFRIVMVDEYQDSNVAQFELLKQLAGEGNAVCVVGDDDQSIYKFRGAEVRNILSFPEQFSDTHIIRLEQNYRSTGPILEIASGVVANNSNRLGKKLWTERTEGVNAKIVYLDNQTEEADFCAGLLGDGNLNGTAILYRTNAQSRSFETCFSRLGIPYRIVGALRFLEREEIKDVIAFLSLLMNPNDAVAFSRIINKPARGIGKTRVEKIILESGESAGGNLIETISGMKFPKNAAAGVAIFLDLYGFMTENVDRMPLAEFIADLVSESKLLDHYSQKDEARASSKKDNLDELVSAAVGYGGGREALSLFLEEMELDREAVGRKADDGSDAPEQDAVTLITMHNTKGLEFDRVIITGMENGIFPSGREEGPDEIEEERRIFYVSITRARNELYFTSCSERRIWGTNPTYGPSIFLSEIPEDFVEVVNNTGGGYGGGFGRSYNRDVSIGSDTKYRPGTPVYHGDYGSGIIAKSGTAGDQVYVIVQFETGRSGRFLPAFDAHLEIFENDDWN